MEQCLDRRNGPGRRTSDIGAEAAAKGLLHDLGHEMTAVYYLAEALRGNGSMPARARDKADLLVRELSRVLDMISHGLWAGLPGSHVDAAAAARQLAQLYTSAWGTQVTVSVSGDNPDTTVPVDPTLLWRVLANVTGNAVRAAGPEGHVEIRLAPAATPGQPLVIAVIDDGPGPGAAPPGTGSMGLRVVESLLGPCGGSVRLLPAPGRGTIARVVLPTTPHGARSDTVSGTAAT